jgi:hypothetical protein
MKEPGRKEGRSFLESYPVTTSRGPEKKMKRRKGRRRKRNLRDLGISF